MDLVLTIVRPTFDFKKNQDLKNKLLAFLKKNQIPNQRILNLNKAKAFEIYFSKDQKVKKKIIASFFKRKKLDFCLQNNFLRKKKVFFCDMDGTIIKNETFNDLGEALQLKEEISKITFSGMKGEISFKKSLESRVQLLKGKSTTILKNLEEKIIFTPGAFSLLKTLKKNRVKTILVTAGFSPISRYVQKKVGFNKLISNHYEIKDLCFTGKIKGKLVLPTTKREVLEKFLKESGLRREYSLALGDAINDLEMLEKAGLGVAYRGVDKLREKISEQINHSDLTTLLYFQGYREEDIIM